MRNCKKAFVQKLVKNHWITLFMTTFALEGGELLASLLQFSLLCGLCVQLLLFSPRGGVLSVVSPDFVGSVWYGAAYICPFEFKKNQE